jgi:CheY-like chemotaxis protein
MVRATILIVDDEAPIRDLLELILQDLGHRVLTAINGRHALIVAASEHPDLVISDMMMPAMDGIELTRRLKAGDAGDQAPPIILMSAAGSAAAVGRGAADAFIQKPFDLEAMEKLVDRWLGWG